MRAVFSNVFVCLALVALLMPGGCLMPERMPDSAVADAPPDFETAQADLRAAIAASGLRGAAGECGSAGLLFTFKFIAPTAWQYDWFDRQTGQFVGRSVAGHTDVLGIEMRAYWPRPLGCGSPTVTDPLGSTYQVGDLLPPPL